MFLADFDLLHDSCQDVRDHPWTKPTFHIMIDQHFKLECTREEIQHLNIKIPHVITYIQDEDASLWLKEVEVRKVNLGLAHQVEKYWLECRHFNNAHMCQFRKLSTLPGFVGSIIPGVRIELRRGDTPMEVDKPPSCTDKDNGWDGDSDEEGEEDNDQEDEDISAIISALLALTVDEPSKE